MNRRTRSHVLVFVSSAVACVAPMLFMGSAKAQAKPKPAPKRSFSNAKKGGAPRQTPTGRTQPTQEQLTEAILGESLLQLDLQTERHFHEGEYNHMINLERIIVQGDPHNMDAYATAAYYLWSLGVDATGDAKKQRYDEAEALLNQGIVANPSSFYMYDEMGTYWWLERKDPKSAIPFFEKAVKFDCPWQTWNSLANCYEKMNIWDKAVSAWEKAAFYPNDVVAARRLKQARDRAAQQKSGK
jgi:tetratricopeptide (TPR) repeat protein